ncbi:16S rRNA (guanine(527)-N(7))-methyltransferase RsmG [Parasphingopyxis algicola]|uniref:16S rRNA (guanine(527)-N(7))-methyltransferase RsmG n=1 Tax=Parasphingopyxis algicola TaxID=2026624 RepID=UPI0015A4E67E|nr:16S rRNA (guanine(527)-N(7))-methyltransferase RsmG [Parasphingopyxis algicola]QLC25647.1 16S rRNA (guanine(527)-N(7))-methyltransferase RsmG [Parasphingopyxis algicola]
MEESDVRKWIADSFDVSRETFERLDLFVVLLLEEAQRQNLISRSTVGSLWDRHIRDSAQLLSLVPSECRKGRWIDLGSGPGLPGLVLAIIGGMDMTLVEVRARRIAFLQHVRERLDLGNQVRIEGRKLERVETAPHDIITARAFAPLPKLLELSHRFSHAGTQWLLPKGKSAQEELEEAQRTWQGDFALVPSQTDEYAFIVTARNVRPRRRS